MNIIQQIEVIVNRVFDKHKIYQQECTVIDVDATSCTCTVKPLNGDSERYNVLLQGESDTTLGFMVVPKVNSTVIIGYLNKSQSYVIKTSEVENIRINAGGESLKDTLNGLINTLNTAVITTPAGVGAFAPQTITKFNEAIAKINKILI
jgi:hypothetical protein